MKWWQEIPITAADAAFKFFTCPLPEKPRQFKGKCKFCCKEFSSTGILMYLLFFLTNIHSKVLHFAKCNCDPADLLFTWVKLVLGYAFARTFRMLSETLSER